MQRGYGGGGRPSAGDGQWPLRPHQVQDTLLWALPQNPSTGPSRLLAKPEYESSKTSSSVRERSISSVQFTAWGYTGTFAPARTKTGIVSSVHLTSFSHR